MNRLQPIEGLRGYLALWVIVGHVMGFAGVDYAYFPHGGFWYWLAAFFRHGDDAVFIFMMISGFVIFLLIDQKREPYFPFFIRRFFRLYPLYLVVLTIGLLELGLHHWVIENSDAYFSAPQRAYFREAEDQTQRSLMPNLILHLGMLQGSVPDSWMGRLCAFSFVGPAWSISVEWQFYLVAPLVYAGLVAGRAQLVGTVLATLMIILLVQTGHWPPSQALLLFYLQYFAVGIASYFTYRHFHARPTFWALPAAVLLSLGIFLISGRRPEVAPLLFWVPFAGLLCTPHADYGWLRIIFTNAATEYLGTISYSLYLSHEVILVILQYVTIRWLPLSSMAAHFWILLGLTMPVTIAVSAVLHRFIELPGMAMGSRLSKRYTRPPQVAA